MHDAARASLTAAGPADVCAMQGMVASIVKHMHAGAPVPGSFAALLQAIQDPATGEPLKDDILLAETAALFFAGRQGQQACRLKLLLTSMTTAVCVCHANSSSLVCKAAVNKGPKPSLSCCAGVDTTSHTITWVLYAPLLRCASLLYWPEPLHAPAIASQCTCLRRD